ncbi:cilia- and flagella-associated protein 100 [Megalopta genalis]|uniref:cilia- and flagella-associated protein 100 n=1 Tax=Megalopta genalis TaxID=115081 RepID=UPI003FD44ADB
MSLYINWIRDLQPFLQLLYTVFSLYRTQYYFTKGHEHLGEAINLNKEQTPFAYPPCSLMFSYFQYWKAVKRSANLERRKGVTVDAEKNKEFLRTLRVDVDLEALEAKKHKDLDEAMAITDVDPGFFKLFTNRVVKEKFSVNEYVDDLRSIFKARLLAGQETDDCIRIDQQFVEEQRRLDNIRRRYSKYVSVFEDFLAKDHEISMAVLMRAEEEAKESRTLTGIRNDLFRQYGQVRLDVYMWEENWRMVKMCQRFVFQVSPITWRTEHDWIHRTESGECVVTDNDLFGRYRMVDEVPSLDCLIEMFEEDIAAEGPTEMYFEDPFDLIRVFRAIETQNLNALIHVESMAVPMSEMMSQIETAEVQIKAKVEELESAIAELEASIFQLETRAADLKMLANTLLEGAFRNAVCSEEVLRFQVFIEDAYESCIGPNDANLDSFSMMKWIEKTHEDLNLELDTLPPEIVQICEKEGFKQELRAMRETEEAARKFELMHRLLDALKRVMEPPAIKSRPMVWRSEPTTQRAKPTPPPPVPTDEEWQYLTFFTNYCHQEDFTEYRARFPDDFDLTFQPKQPEVPSEVAEAEREVENEQENEQEDK